MFKKENNNFDELETIIGPSVKVEGDFVGQGNLVIDGTVNGNIKTNGNLKIGNSAVITASIQAKNALVSGKVQGNVTINGDLEITANAGIMGDIECQSISIERGAMINGKCTMKTTENQSVPKNKNVNNEGDSNNA